MLPFVTIGQFEGPGVGAVGDEEQATASVANKTIKAEVRRIMRTSRRKVWAPTVRRHARSLPVIRVIWNESFETETAIFVS